MQAQTYLVISEAPVVSDLETGANTEPPLFAKMTAPAGAVWWPAAGQVATRGAALPVLYGSLIALEAFDGYSTTRGLQGGAVESNSLMSTLLAHPGAFWAVKGATTFTSIFVAERLWRQHRRASAIAVMVVTNAVMMGVAANNAAILRGQK